MIIENIVPVLKGLNSRLLSHFPPKLTTILLGTRVEFLFVAADMRIAWTLGPPYLIVYTGGAGAATIQSLILRALQ